MTEYKRGDKLRLIGKSDRYFTEGETYEVVFVESNAISVIDDTRSNHILTNDFVPECFDVVEGEE